MKRAWAVYTVDFILLVVCAIGFYQSEQKAGLPFVFRSGGLIIENINDPSLAGKFQVNDKIKSIDNYELSDQEFLEYYLDGKSIGRQVVISVERNGKELSIPVVLSPFYSTVYLAVQLFVGLSFLILAFLIYKKQSNLYSANVLHWLFVFVMTLIFTTQGKYNVEPYGIGFLARCCFLLSYSAAPVLFVHFSFVYPQKKWRMQNRLLLLIYTFAVLNTLLMTYYFLEYAADQKLEMLNNYDMFFDLCRTILAVLIAVGVVNFIHSYFTVGEEPERRKLRWIILGLFIGPSCFAALWVLPQVMRINPIVSEEIILLAMLSVPFSFTISILKYHLFDIDYIFERGTVYFSVLFSIIIIYGSAVGLVSLLIGTVTLSTSFAAASITAVIIAFLLQPLKDRIQKFVDKKFFRVRYNYRDAATAFVNKIINSYDLNTLSAFVLNYLDEFVRPEKKEIVLADRELDSPNIFINEDFQKDAVKSIFKELSTTANCINIPLAVKNSIEAGKNFIEGDRIFFDAIGLKIVFALVSKENRFLGLLLLGAKKSGFPFYHEDIDLLNSICIQTSLSIERINLQQKLMWERTESQRLKELNEIKSFFVSSVSHELKTPLTSINIYSEMIEENLKDQKDREYIEILKGETNRLGRLIDNFLNISKIEKGIKEYRFSPVDIVSCVESVLKSMKYLFEINELKLEYDLPDHPCIIYADKDAVEEAVMNVLSNAIKYSGGGKRIAVKVKKDGTCIKITVEDEGIGIPADQIENIFKPYFRLNNINKNGAPGTGIGLTLVKHIVENHNGKIFVKSVQGKGSVFTMEFPTINEGAEDEKIIDN